MKITNTTKKRRQQHHVNQMNNLVGDKLPILPLFETTSEREVREHPRTGTGTYTILQ